MSGLDAPDRGDCRHTFGDEPGPIDADQECDHSGQLPQDPPFQYVQDCETTATFAVRHPGGLGQCIAFCPWHLARFLDAYPEREERLREHFQLDQHLPDDGWIGLDDLPSYTQVQGEDDRWPLFAFDQRGRAYYTDVLENPRGVAIYADGDWEMYDAYVNVPRESTLRDVVDKIADLYGLAALPSQVVDRCSRSNGGDGQ